MASFRAGARADLQPAYEQFRNEQADWLEDYALFRALKARFNDAYYLEWPADLVQRHPAAIDRARRELADEIGCVCFAQFLLFRQGERLKAHARSKGLGLIGDLPFFVSPDSSDVDEFRDMVKAVHRAGIEVILDVVFNHTSEGDHNGPTLSLRGLDNNTYYILDQDRSRYRNYSGRNSVCTPPFQGHHTLE